MDPRLVLPVADGALREQVSRLETDIERLSDVAQRCRKIAVAAQAAIGAGCVLLASLLVGAIGADALSLMISAILIIGGIVLLGSNETTLKQTLTRIEDAERLRAALISQMELTLVPETTRLLH
jgi:small neutral amino acid transporter SnatA (MarC family)